MTVSETVVLSRRIVAYGVTGAKSDSSLLMALPRKFSDSPFQFRNRILRYVPVNQYYPVTYTGSFGWDCLVGKATPCKLEGTGFQPHSNKSIIRPSPPLHSPNLLHNGYRDSFSGAERPGPDFDRPSQF